LNASAWFINIEADSILLNETFPIHLKKNSVDIDPLYFRENRTVPFGAVPFGTEPFHTSSLKAKRLQMVPDE